MSDNEKLDNIENNNSDSNLETNNVINITDSLQSKIEKANEAEIENLNKELNSQPQCYICLKLGKKPEESYAFHICRHPSCNKYHCAEHTSNVDMDKCSRCSEDVTVEVSKLSKTTVKEEYDEVRDEVLTETESHTAKSIHFTGKHWLSNSVIIGSMTDQKLKSSIEYHKAMVRLMEEELIHRKINKSKAHLASHPFAAKRLGNRIVKDGVITSVSETKTRVTRRKSSDPADKILSAMQSGGIDITKLIEMLQKKVSGK